MSDPDWIAWAALQPSALRRRVLRFALLASVVVLAAATVAAWQAPDALRLSAFYLAGAAFLVAFIQSRRRPVGGQLRLSAAGEVSWRADPSAEQRTLAPRFASRSLVVLADAQGRVVVWADALPAADYRRLSALLRWSRASGDRAP
ncbi:MAG: protein YgfX [Betaproteobacteria bacterium]